jgi:hypothetical protein
LEERLADEEAAFAADLRNEERPVDRKLNGGAKPRTRRKGRTAAGQKSLFERD